MNKRGDTITNSTEIKRTVRESYEQLNSNKLENLN